MRWLALLLPLALCAACTDDTDTTSDGGSNPGGMGGSSEGGGGEGGMAGMGGIGGMGGMGGMGGACVNTLPNEEMPPATLSETGLYSDIANKTLQTYVEEFAPQFPLWTDAAAKRRWVYLPECDPIIDNTDEDSWSLPVGTRMWKEFERDGQLIETRLVHRYGPGDDDFSYATYRWTDDDSEANLLLTGETDAKGTEHDIPTQEECLRCHGGGVVAGGLPSRYLGFSAIQLSHSGPGVTMESLSNDGHLLMANAAGYTVPGNATEQAALGYLHSNCASCHNETADGIFLVDARMRLLSTDMAVMLTQSYTTLVDTAPNQFFSATCNLLIDSGDAANSCIVERMSARGTDDTPNPAQMPPLGTTEVDTVGVDAVTAWVNSLP